LHCCLRRSDFAPRLAVSYLEAGFCKDYGTPDQLRSYELEAITMPFTEPLAWPLKVQAAS
jgi:hypothetical protein